MVGFVALGFPLYVCIYRYIYIYTQYTCISILVAMVGGVYTPISNLVNEIGFDTGTWMSFFYELTEKGLRCREH